MTYIEYFENYLKDIDLCDRMLEDGKASQNGFLEMPIKISNDRLSSFINTNGISVESFFISAFAYTLSRFTGGNFVQFCVSYQNNSFPILIKCRNKKCVDYLVDVYNNFFKLKNFQNIDIKNLKEKYFIDTSTWFLFQDSSNSIKINHNFDNKFEFFIQEINNAFSVKVNYSDCYLKERIESFLDTFELVAEGLLQYDILSEINILPKKHLELYNRINDTDHELEYNDIIEAWNANVKKYPNNLCVRYEDIVYTYQEVEYITNYIIDKLIRLNIKPRDAIGFMVQRGVLYLMCSIALLKYDAIYVPLDETLPENRICLMLNEVNAKCVLMSKQTYDKCVSVYNRYDNSNLKMLLIDMRFLKNALKEKKQYISTIPDNNTVFATVFTSGTTNVPKGVLLNRLTIINLAQWYKNHYNITPKDTYAFYYGVSYVIHLFMFYAIFVGGCVDIVPEKCRLNMPLLNKFFENHKITHTQLPSRICKTFFTNFNNSNVKIVITGGEPIEDYDYFGSVKIFEQYGATEAPATFTCDNYKIEKNILSCIGTVNDNLRSYIIDAEYRRVPLYALGNLCIAGNNIASGYLNDKKLTKRFFKKNIFEEPNTISHRMFMSGDFAYYQSNGEAIYVGRKDTIIKLRGYRIDLKEIETCILRLKEVDNAVVVATKINEDVKLIACVVTNSNITSTKIKEYVKAKKPDFMIPKFVVFNDTIPLNKNGKLDQNFIVNKAKKVLGQNAAIQKTDDYIKNRLMISFAKALSVDESIINDNSNFLELGGDSMTAVQLSMLYKDNLDLSIAPVEIMKNPVLKNHYKLLIKNKKNKDYNNLHIFNKNPNKPKLVFVHPGIGGAESYINLSKELRDEIEFSCIEHYNLLNLDSDVLSIQELAERNIKILKGYQKHGPYYLGGYSFGGVVALEMAQKLKKEREEVRCLFLLDSPFDHIRLNKKQKEIIFKKLKNYVNNNYSFILDHYNICALEKSYADKVIDYYLWNRINCSAYKAKKYNGKTIFFISDWKNEDNIDIDFNEIMKMPIAKYYAFMDNSIFRENKLKLKYRATNKILKNAFFQKINYLHWDFVKPEASKEIATTINNYFEGINREKL